MYKYRLKTAAPLDVITFVFAFKKVQLWDSGISDLQKT